MNDDDIISLTEFKNDASGWIERLQSRPPVVLTQNGRGRAVVQSYESFQHMRSQIAMLQVLSRADADIREGRTIPHEQVMADVRARIAQSAARLQAAAEPKRSAQPKARPVGGKRRVRVSDRDEPWQLRWTTAARHDLLEIAALIAEDAPLTVLKIVDRIEVAAEKLRLFPRRCRRVPELARDHEPEVRETFVRPWRIVFEVRDPVVIVTAVVDGRRELMDWLQARVALLRAMDR